MQANKADESVMRDLKQWLENPNVSAGAGKEDLSWLQNSTDLSSVNLNGKMEKSAMRQPSNTGDGRGGGNGGIAHWFSSCAGKRK